MSISNLGGPTCTFGCPSGRPNMKPFFFTKRHKHALPDARIVRVELNEDYFMKALISCVRRTDRERQWLVNWHAGHSFYLRFYPRVIYQPVDLDQCQTREAGSAPLDLSPLTAGTFIRTRKKCLTESSIN